MFLDLPFLFFEDLLIFIYVLDIIDNELLHMEHKHLQLIALLETEEKASNRLLPQIKSRRMWTEKDDSWKRGLFVPGLFVFLQKSSKLRFCKRALNYVFAIQTKVDSFNSTSHHSKIVGVRYSLEKKVGEIWGVTMSIPDGTTYQNMLALQQPITAANMTRYHSSSTILSSIEN
jgi:hypothetical protein